MRMRSRIGNELLFAFLFSLPLIFKKVKFQIRRIDTDELFFLRGGAMDISNRDGKGEVGNIRGFFHPQMHSLSPFLFRRITPLLYSI